MPSQECLWGPEFSLWKWEYSASDNFKEIAWHNIPDNRWFAQAWTSWKGLMIILRKKDWTPPWLWKTLYWRILNRKVSGVLVWTLLWKNADLEEWWVCWPWRSRCLLMSPYPWEGHQWTGPWLFFEMMKLKKHAKNTFLSCLVCSQHFSEDSLHFHQFQDVEPGWTALSFISGVGSDSYRAAECDTPSLQWRSVWTHHTCDWQTGLLSIDKATPV